MPFKSICVLFLTSITSLVAQTFQKTYGGSGLEFCWNLKPTFDKNFMFIGNSNSFGTPGIYLVKINNDGDTLWTKAIGGNASELGLNAHQTNDGGMMVIGQTYSFGAGNADAFVTRLDTAEQILWSKTYGGIYNDEFVDIIPVGGNGFVFMGTSSSFGDSNTNFDIYLIRIDAMGDTIWTKTIAASGYDAPLDIQQTTDDGYIITGYTNSFSSGQDEIFLIKTDSNASIEWTKLYSGAGGDVGSSVVQTPDHGYMVVGKTHSFGSGEGHLFILKTDVNGDLVWAKKFIDPYLVWGYHLIRTQNDEYAITGQGQILGTGGTHAFLLKINAAGSIIWSHLYGGNELDHARAVVEMEDGGFMLGGVSNDVGAGGWDYYAIRTDNMGYTGCLLVDVTIEDSIVVPAVSTPTFYITTTNTVVSSQTPSSSRGAIITTLCSTVGVEEWSYKHVSTFYPNPITDQLYISVTTNSEITIIDALGKIRHVEIIEESKYITLGYLEPGIYSLCIKNKWGESSEKIIIIPTE
jgi:hypothetical protein